MYEREKAFALLQQHISSERLIKHSLAVEAGMITYANIYGEDRNRWGAIGLLHDIDYEKYPEEHGIKSAEILRGAGYDEELIKSVQGHASELSGVERESQEAKVLFAVDQMCGFMVACALVRDPKGFEDMKVKSIKKKFKDKAFARAISREHAVFAAEALGLEFDQHIANLIEGMGQREKELNALGVSLL